MFDLFVFDWFFFRRGMLLFVQDFDLILRLRVESVTVT